MPKPKVFINNVKKNIKNNIDVFYFKKDIKKIENKKEEFSDVSETIFELFNSDDFVYKIKVDITLKNKDIITKDVVAIKEDALIDIDGNKIRVNDILSIKKAN